MTPAALHRRFLLLGALRWFPVGVFAPLLVLLAQSRGLSVAEIGIAFLPFGLTAALLELPTGGLADSVGRRPVLVAAALLQAVGLVAFAVAPGLLWICVAGVVIGVSRALDSGPLEAWYVDAAHELGGVDIRRGLAHSEVAIGLALGLGSVVGGLLPPLLDALPERGAAVTSLSLPILVAAALSLGGAVLAARLVAEPGRHGADAATRPSLGGALRGGLRVATRVPDARRLLLGTAALGVVLTVVEMLWPVRLAELLGEDGAGTSGAVGVLMGAAFAVSAAGAAVAPRLASLLRGSAVAGSAVGQAATGLAVVALAASGHVVPAVVAYVLVYAALGAAAPLQRELLHGCVDSSARSVLLSASSLSLQGAGVVTKVTLIPLAATGGIPVAWLITGVLTVATVPALLRVSADRSRPATGVRAEATPAT